MKRLVSLGLLTSAIALGATFAAAQERPKLVVLCSVDQLATWVHALGEPFYSDGFARLRDAGVTDFNAAVMTFGDDTLDPLLDLLQSELTS